MILLISPRFLINVHPLSHISTFFSVESGNWITFELKYEEFFKINPNVCGLTMRYEDFMLVSKNSTSRDPSVYQLVSGDQL